MIEIACQIHHFDIGKSQEKDCGGQTVFITKGQGESSQRTNDKKQISVITQGLDKFKTIVMKEKFGFYI